MTQPSSKQRPERRSRRVTRENGLPYLAAQLPKNFRTAAAINGFIYSLAVEVTAGRVESRRGALLGYLTQLALQTLPQLRFEKTPEGSGRRIIYQFVANAPRPDYSKLQATSETNAGSEGSQE